MTSEIFSRFNHHVARCIVDGIFTGNQVLYRTADGNELDAAAAVLPLEEVMALSIRTVSDYARGGVEAHLLRVLESTPVGEPAVPVRPASPVVRDYNRWLADHLAAGTYTSQYGISTFYRTSLASSELVDARRILGRRWRSQRWALIPEHQVGEYEERMLITMTRG